MLRAEEVEIESRAIVGDHDLERAMPEQRANMAPAVQVVVIVAGSKHDVGPATPPHICSATYPQPCRRWVLSERSDSVSVALRGISIDGGHTIRTPIATDMPPITANYCSSIEPHEPENRGFPGVSGIYHPKAKSVPLTWSPCFARHP